MPLTASQRKTRERAKRKARGEKLYWLTPTEQSLVEGLRNAPASDEMRFHYDPETYRLEQEQDGV